MLNVKYTRTTITLPAEILWEIKKRALFEKRAIKEVVVDGLSLYLFNFKKYSPETAYEINVDSLFGIWGKGIRGKSFIRKIRDNREDKKRDDYLKELWKRS